MFGHPSSAMLVDTIRSLAELRVPHEVVGGVDARARWDLGIRADEIAVLTPEAGWVDAALAVSATVDLAMQQGAVFVEEAADPWTLTDNFDQVVACVGAWAPEMFGAEASVTCQTVAYVELGRSWRGPVYIEDTPDFVYGFPSEWGTTNVKVGVHTPGITIDPNDETRPVNEAMLERIRQFACDRFGVSEPEITEVVTCLYTNTADEDFRWGVRDGVIWASPCSGHGFKFGPWIGARLADFAEGTRQPSDWARFWRG
jgi:sarcosine oxidase